LLWLTANELISTAPDGTLTLCQLSAQQAGVPPPGFVPPDEPEPPPQLADAEARSSTPNAVTSLADNKWNSSARGVRNTIKKTIRNRHGKKRQS
jgi:hypothetical protein